jgi:hypothetical protein
MGGNFEAEPSLTLSRVGPTFIFYARLLVRARLGTIFILIDGPQALRNSEAIQSLEMRRSQRIHAETKCHFKRRDNSRYTINVVCDSSYLSQNYFLRTCSRAIRPHAGTARPIRQIGPSPYKGPSDRCLCPSMSSAGKWNCPIMHAAKHLLRISDLN